MYSDDKKIEATLFHVNLNGGQKLPKIIQVLCSSSKIAWVGVHLHAFASFYVETTSYLPFHEKLDVFFLEKGEKLKKVSYFPLKSKKLPVRLYLNWFRVVVIVKSCMVLSFFYVYVSSIGCASFFPENLVCNFFNNNWTAHAKKNRPWAYINHRECTCMRASRCTLTLLCDWPVCPITQ